MQRCEGVVAVRLTVVASLLVVSACTVPPTEETGLVAPTSSIALTTPSSAATTSSATVVSSAATVSTTEGVVSEQTEGADEVASIVIEPEHDGGYERKLFKHWSDADNDGCDTRREVLIEESLAPVTVGSGCSLEGGRWYSAFDGIETSDPSKFDVDHMVPLKEAWDSGAWQWDSLRRQAFANDTSIPEALIAVSASSNRSKGAKDPAEWLPPLEAFHCQYVAAWIEVKQRWNLSMDQSEYDAVSLVRNRC